MFRPLLAALLCACALQVQAAPFTLTDTAGATHALADYRGKWVVVNVWASWCAPCLAEMPELEALSRGRGDLVVLGLAADGLDARRVDQFAQRLGVSYPVIAGDEQALRQFRLRAFPTTVVYNPQGEQALVKEGRVTRAEIEGLIAAAQAARPGLALNAH